MPLRVLSVLRVSGEWFFGAFYHHGNTENTEVGQGIGQHKVFPTGPRFFQTILELTHAKTNAQLKIRIVQGGNVSGSFTVGDSVNAERDYCPVHNPINTFVESYKSSPYEFLKSLWKERIPTIAHWSSHGERRITNPQLSKGTNAVCRWLCSSGYGMALGVSAGYPGIPDQDHAQQLRTL